MSSTTMNWAATISARTIQRRRSGVAAGIGVVRLPAVISCASKSLTPSTVAHGHAFMYTGCELMMIPTSLETPPRPIQHVARELADSSGFLLVRLGFGLKAKALADVGQGDFELYDYTVLAIL